ncbi:peptide transporter [Klebsormidium nitens]|uniref:Peptide transporter n=1 Tax=Klebsormidium nitens TaxID=105231 RepID=A0A0U9HIM1_KLENI|nr:peptide transporter [Klebsormidium nitens]|eukprot:GAQ80562.1 peptide transporter [Klebsormidium nitens]
MEPWEMEAGMDGPRKKGNPIRVMPFILANEFCERLAYYGISTNLVNYLIVVLHKGNGSAATAVTNWSGTCYITPLIGAFLADAYWGRFLTILVFSVIYFVGMVLLTVDAAVPSLHPSADSSGATAAQTGLFFLALYIIALGTGGIKPCVSSFGADQFDERNPREKKQKSAFFNWFYFSINVGALISSSILVWVQERISWAWGFGIPAAAMGVAIVSFFVATPWYRKLPPGGSPLTRVAQVLTATAANWRLKTPADPDELYEVEGPASAIRGSRKIKHTNELTFLDKAAIVPAGAAAPGARSPWKVSAVEEVKLVVRLLPIWGTTIAFSTVYAQMSTLFVVQGGTMDTSMGPHFNIPAASLSIFDTLSVIVCVPLYDALFVPIMRRFTGNPRGVTMTWRMGIGLFISCLSMAAAAILEAVRLHVVHSRNLTDVDPSVQPVPISIFWQIPQYFLVGAAEVFTFIGQLEFFYDQAPDAMRSLASALSLTTIALGNYLSSLLVTIITSATRRGGSPGWIPDNLNRGRIDLFFTVLLALSAVNLGLYVLAAHAYKYKQVQEIYPPGTEGDDREVAELDKDAARLAAGFRAPLPPHTAFGEASGNEGK